MQLLIQTHGILLSWNQYIRNANAIQTHWNTLQTHSGMPTITIFQTCEHISPTCKHHAGSFVKHVIHHFNQLPHLFTETSQRSGEAASHLWWLWISAISAHAFVSLVHPLNWWGLASWVSIGVQLTQVPLGCSMLVRCKNILEIINGIISSPSVTEKIPWLRISGECEQHR